MNKHIIRSVALAAAFALFAAVPSIGQPYHTFVTVGDSLIAGEESGCVVQRFQERSWVALAAKSLGLQNDFQQPFIQELAATNPLTNYPCVGATFDGTSISVGVVSMIGPNLNAALPVPYNNLGFNGSPLISDFVNLTVTMPGTSDLDNLAAPVLRNFQGGPFYNMSAVDEANSLNPDLVAFWGGNNDVLNAVFAGVAIVGVTITPVDSFTASYNQVMTDLSASGRTLVSFNVPDVASIPYATTIPPVVVNPTTRQPVIINGQPVPLLGPGDSAYPCTPVPPDQGCALPAGSLVSILASSLLGQGIGIPTAVGGTGQPLPHGSFTPPSTLNIGVVLYPDDVALIQQTTVAYNQAIAAAVTANGAILIDANASFKVIGDTGYDIGGIHLTSSYLTGGLFSYDGVHPSAIGYGILADTFIRTLNAVKGTSYPRPNFSNILFEPNVPDISSASVRDGGPWGYSLEMGRDFLVRTFSARGMTVTMPPVSRMTPQPARSAPRAPAGAPTRSVERDAAH